MKTSDLEEIRHAMNRLRAKASEGPTMQTSTVMNETAIVMDAIYRAERSAPPVPAAEVNEDNIVVPLEPTYEMATALGCSWEGGKHFRPFPGGVRCFPPSPFLPVQERKTSELQNSKGKTAIPTTQVSKMNNYKLLSNRRFPTLVSCHPLVRELFASILAHPTLTVTSTSLTAGLGAGSISNWGRDRVPTLQNFEAALNVLGLKLAIVPCVSSESVIQYTNQPEAEQ